MMQPLYFVKVGRYTINLARVFGCTELNNGDICVYGNGDDEDYFLLTGDDAAAWRNLFGDARPDWLKVWHL